MTELRIDQLESPVGTIRIATHDGSLCALGFFDPDAMHGRLTERFGAPAALKIVETDDPTGITSRLRAYFAGRLDALDDIVVDPAGTPFQRRVWRALREIPCGETRSYKQIAEGIGKPTATRAVGGANHRNPIGIVIPCHRVVNEGGRLGGYAGGVTRKRWLLDHEGALPSACVPGPESTRITATR